MKYDYNVVYNGKFYNSGENVPVKEKEASKAAKKETSVNSVKEPIKPLTEVPPIVNKETTKKTAKSKAKAPEEVL